MDDFDLLHNSLNNPPIEFLSLQESKKVCSFVKKKRWAKAMKRNPTKAEATLWSALKSYTKYKPRRQYVIFGFIADIAFLKRRIIVEADGSSHKERVDHDRMRDAAFRKNGWKTLRFTNEQILNDISSVCASINTALGKAIAVTNKPKAHKSGKQPKVTSLDKLENEFRRTKSQYSYDRWMKARKANEPCPFPTRIK